MDFLFALFVVLSIADAITTYQALDRSGTREANPVMRWLFDRFGVVPSLVGVYSVWVLAVINAGYAFVVWRNHYRVGR